MALRPRHFVMMAFPIVLALLFAAWQTQGLGNMEDGLFEESDTPALELLQRSAKITHMSKQPPLPNPIQEAIELVQGHMHLQGHTHAVTPFGVSSNGVGNLPIFLYGLLTDATIVTVCLCMFTGSSRRYPIMFSDNVMKGFAPLSEIPPGIFGWATASMGVTLDEAWNSAGLDHAMLLEFASLSMNTMMWIALPMFFIQGPLNCFFGGNAAGLDHESWFSMGNVEFFCWLYWPISIFICWVSWNICSMCHTGMRTFLPRRFEWLRAMDKVRANTIMMIGIPERYQSDEACKAFWDDMLPGGKVESVNLVKDTSSEKNLQGLVAQRNEAKYHLELAEAAWAKDDKDPDKRPTIKTSYFGSHVDAMEEYKKQIDELQPQINEAKDDLYEKAKKVGSPNLSAGFITFKDRKDAEIALRLDLSDDVHTWVLDYPPQPADVIWGDLSQNPHAEGGRKLLGYALTAGIVFTYMPIVVFICNVAELINLGPLQPIWSSEAPTLGLTIMVDFLPTILNLIFTNCFSLYDKTQSQYKLSVWYWWMNVLYVVCITALGTNFLSFVETLAKDPLSIFSLLANTMPECTHYYMNYIGMTFYIHAMVLTRYMPLIKFKSFSRNHEEQEAKDMAEPEDQDYYGIGSRTARWSTMMCVGIVYGTLSPPVSMLTWFLFCWIRLVYGYLFCFAETKKSDLGGIFFVRALHNMYTSLHIYMILMLGVFCQRSPNCGPIIIIFLAWGYIINNQKQWNEMKWERLPYTELTSGEKVRVKIQAIKGNYIQPELNDA